MRKTHKKSRLGCLICKRRRIKCDESRPRCNKCVSFGVPCDFSPAVGSERAAAAVPSSTVATASRGRGRPRSDWASWADQIRVTAARMEVRLPPLNTGDLNVDDFELFHHYATRTSHTIADNADELDLFRDGIPRLGLQHPMILRLILALSAYHIAKSEAPNNAKYVSLAQQHLRIGLQSATALLKHLSDADNGPVLYVTSMLVCFIAFAQGPSPGDLLLVASEGRVPWLALLRGVKLVVSVAGWSRIFSGPLAPYRPRESERSQASESEIGARHVELPSGEIEDWQSSLNELSSLVDSCEEQHMREIYKRELKVLQECLESTFGRGRHSQPDVRGKMEVVFSWMYQLEDSLVDALSRLEPVPLVILGHFCVQLATLDRYWFLEGWAAHILQEIVQKSPEQRKWLAWPTAYLEGRAMQAKD